MGTPQSPTRMFNDLDETIFEKEKFAREINERMRVPKRILVTGKCSDDDSLLSNQNALKNSWKYQDKIEMIVPDHIVLSNPNEYVAAYSVPLEIQLDNSILPKNPSTDVRMPTPPRKITLNDHYFPSVLEEDSPLQKLSDAKVNLRPNNDTVLESDLQLKPVVDVNNQSSVLAHNLNDISIINYREGTPIGDLSPSEEIMYLRRQLAKLNRRVLNIEVRNEQRNQREKIIYCVGLAYFFIKALFWLRNN